MPDAVGFRAAQVIDQRLGHQGFQETRDGKGIGEDGRQCPKVEGRVRDQSNRKRFGKLSHVVQGADVPAMAQRQDGEADDVDQWRGDGLGDRGKEVDEGAARRHEGTGQPGNLPRVKLAQLRHEIRMAKALTKPVITDFET